MERLKWALSAWGKREFAPTAIAIGVAVVVWVASTPLRGVVAGFLVQIVLGFAVVWLRAPAERRTVDEERARRGRQAIHDRERFR